MSNQGPAQPSQFVLDQDSLSRIRLRKTQATSDPVKSGPAVPAQATVGHNHPLETILTVKNMDAKLVAKTATIRHAAPNAAAVKVLVPPVRQNSLVKNGNIGRPLPTPPAKKAAVVVPPPLPPRDDVANDIPPPLPPRDAVESSVVASTVAFTSPPPPAPKIPLVTASVANNTQSAKPILLFTAVDLANNKLKKTVTVDKSAPVIGREVAVAATHATIVSRPISTASVGNSFDDELKARLAKRTAIKL